MKEKVKVLGFYRRKRDGSEFILFEENGKMFLTNGVYVWDNKLKRIEKRYTPELEKVEKIDILKIIQDLRKHNKFNLVLPKLEKIAEGGYKCE